MPSLSGFVAYPNQPRAIGDTIRSALEQVRRDKPDIRLESWEENDVAGHFVVSPILSKIDDGNLLLADITRLNFNVVFEVGYAIGRRKRAFLIRSSAITGVEEIVRQVGIFDTLGYEGYANSQELASLISGIEDITPLVVDDSSVNRLAPVYVVLPRIRTDAEIRIVSRIKKARIQFRSFDPEEQGRLAAEDAIENTAESFGVVTLLLSSNRIDADIHNFRASFVAGLALALDKPLLLLQDGDEPVPLDYRDLVKSFRFPDQIDEYIADFSTEVVARLQSAAPPVVSEPKSFLAQLALGASSAENELHELGQYYLETEEFRRAARGEVRIVTGRKGTGKTALFVQLRNRLREHGQLVILDLKPEGFQLLKFKERVLDYLEEGTREHTITAFWEYLLLLETCHKILHKDQRAYLRDTRLYEPYRRLADGYFSDQYICEGDFAERMLRLTQRIADDFDETYNHGASKKRLSTGQITEVLYKHDVAKLRADVVEYLNHKDGLWILFDNLDKGWPPHGVTAEDVVTLRCLIDAMTKLERQLRREGVESHGVVFIRNDVYELLVASTPDRGKVGHIALDWTDPELLRELLRRRFLYTGTIKGDPTFEAIWPQICASHIRGEETSQYMVERSLMRPRGLIDLLRFCRSRAVNLGHDHIETNDIEAGEDAYSSELLNNVAFEIRDVFPDAGEVLYEFIECPAEITADDVRQILVRAVGDERLDKVFDLLLWYGFFGVIRENDEVTYIYDVKYDIRRLKGLIKKRGEGMVRFRINPAFWTALEAQH